MRDKLNSNNSINNIDSLNNKIDSDNNNTNKYTVTANKKKNLDNDNIDLKQNFSNYQKQIEETDEKEKKPIKLARLNATDLEIMNEQSILQFAYKAKRNRLKIIILVLLLTISIASISIYVAMTQRKDNIFLYLHGEVNASFVIDGKMINQFRSPNSIHGNMKYEFDLDLTINEQGTFDVYFKIDVYQGKNLLNNVLLFNKSELFSIRDSNGYYHLKESLICNGSATIDLTEGIIIPGEYEQSLKSSNFKMEVHAYIDRI